MTIPSKSPGHDHLGFTRDRDDGQIWMDGATGSCQTWFPVGPFFGEIYSVFNEFTPKFPRGHSQSLGCQSGGSQEEQHQQN